LEEIVKLHIKCGLILIMAQTQIKFFRVDHLPPNGDVGGVYFLKGENPTLWIYTNDGWENYASGGDSQATDLAGYA
jgi:hypothetical protein